MNGTDQGDARGRVAATNNTLMQKTDSAGSEGFIGAEEEPIVADTGCKRVFKLILGWLVFRQAYLDLANVDIPAAERYYTKRTTSP